METPIAVDTTETRINDWHYDESGKFHGPPETPIASDTSETPIPSDDVKASPINPHLQQFVQQFSNSEAGSDFAVEAAARVQRHLDIQQAADAANAVHAQFINNLDTTKQNLVQMARSDPTSADLALDLSDITMRGLTNSLGHDEDGEHHTALLDHMQGEIAHAAIQGLANIDEDAARSALSSGRLASLIPDDQKGALDSYITNMANVRQTDAQARQQEIIRQHIQGSNSTSTQWLTGLTEPTTGSPWFPDNWGARMLNDERLSPQDRAGLHGAYQNLLANGNPQSSDPDTVTGLMERATLPINHSDHPAVSEVVSHVGNDLTLADAQYIAGRLGPQSQQTNDGTHALVNAMSNARSQIDNQAAYARFVSWVLPQARAGNLDLDPQSQTFSLSDERMQRFMPTGDDIVKPIVGTPSPNRPSLNQIFAGNATMYTPGGMRDMPEHGGSWPGVNFNGNNPYSLYNPRALGLGPPSRPSAPANMNPRIMPLSDSEDGEFQTAWGSGKPHLPILDPNTRPPRPGEPLLKPAFPERYDPRSIGPYDRSGNVG